MNAKIEEILKSLEPKAEDIFLIKTLFSHPGWVKYEETINRDIEFLTGEIEKLTDGKTALTPDRIEHLKLLSVLRYSFRTMIVRKEQLLDDIKNPLVEEPEDEVKENFTPSDAGAE